MSTSRARSRLPAQRAFSLLEVLVAIALVLALLGAMFAFLWDLLGVRRDVIDRSARRLAADTLIERLERDLMTAMVGDSVVGAGVAGDEDSIRVLSRSVPVRLADRRDARRRSFADLERTDYRFETGRGLSVRRAVALPAVGSTGTAADGEDEWFPLGGVLHRVRFRYHDGSVWRDEFDSVREDRLPRAVEAAVWFDPPPEERLAALEEEDDGLTAPPERRTFDTGGGFDERTFAIESDLEDFDEPPPDRVRVIVVPDALTDDETQPTEDAIAAFEPSGRDDGRRSTPALPTTLALGGILAAGVATRHGRHASSSRRSFIIVAVLAIVGSALLVATSVLFMTQAHLAGHTHDAQRLQQRLLAVSGVEAVMSRLDAQRNRILQGDAAELPDEIVLYETDDRIGVVRLLAMTPSGARVVPEAGRLDLNMTDAATLVKTGLVDEMQAERIVTHRDDTLGGSYQSVAELLLVPGIDAETLYGPLEALRLTDDAEGLEADVATRVAGRLSDDTARGLGDVVTVYGVEPALQRSGVLRINLNVPWSPELGARLDERFGEGAGAAVKGMIDGGTAFDSDAKIVQAMRQTDLEIERWSDVIDAVTTESGEHHFGRVDINTAPYEVLAAVPGLDEDTAASIVRAREGIPADERATIVWPLLEGIVEEAAYDDLAGRITTRSWTYRVRLSAAERPIREADESGIDDGTPDGWSAPVIVEAVIDLSDPRPRIAYLRDVSLLQTAAILASGVPFEDDEMGFDDEIDADGASDDPEAGFGTGTGTGSGTGLREPERAGAWTGAGTDSGRPAEIDANDLDADKNGLPLDRYDDETPGGLGPLHDDDASPGGRSGMDRAGDASASATIGPGEPGPSARSRRVGRWRSGR